MNTPDESLTEIAIISEAQNRLLAEWLLSGRRIIGAVATEKLGIGHLPRRIKDLIEFHALPIERDWKKYPRRFDKKITKVKEYWIPLEKLPELKKDFSIEHAFAKVNGKLINKIHA